MEENLQKLSPNQPKELDEKIQKSPPQKWISKILKKKTPPKKNNNAKYNHKQILDNCKKKKKIRLFITWKFIPNFINQPKDTEHH